ncbi:MAG: hypothetical protein CMJ81_07910 [Planctomycetaceae bacterium]|jgi:hypothetical protein|nr:hypothetical protein [Planctomycetaceae bacterium]MBP63282.1 hypothetical protein [Planctomycetaceae bacterium]
MKVGCKHQHSLQSIVGNIKVELFPLDWVLVKTTSQFGYWHYCTATPSIGAFFRNLLDFRPTARKRRELSLFCTPQDSSPGLNPHGFVGQSRA